jgi:hypothetical protein
VTPELVGSIALLSFLTGLFTARVAEWTSERWARRAAREILGDHPRRIVVTKILATPCPMAKCVRGRVGEKLCPICNGVGWLP